MPLSLPFLWLLFTARRNVTLYDHSVFILYSVSFMLLFGTIGVLMTLLPNALTDPIAGFAVLVPPLHVFAYLKGAYGLSIRGRCGGPSCC